jgi:hypothetical protein
VGTGTGRLSGPALDPVFVADEHRVRKVDEQSVCDDPRNA